MIPLDEIKFPRQKDKDNSDHQPVIDLDLSACGSCLLKIALGDLRAFAPFKNWRSLGCAELTTAK